MSTSENTNSARKKPRQKGGSLSGASPAVRADATPKRRLRTRFVLDMPDYVYEGEALRWSWEAMQESGGWR